METGNCGVVERDRRPTGDKGQRQGHESRRRICIGGRAKALVTSPSSRTNRHRSSLLSVMSTVLQSPFIISGSTVQAGRICGDVLPYHRGLNVVVIVYPHHFSSRMGVAFACVNSRLTILAVAA